MYRNTIAVGLLMLLPMAAAASPPVVTRFVLGGKQADQPKYAVPRNAPRILRFENVQKRTLSVRFQNYAAHATKLIVERRQGSSWLAVHIVNRVDHRQQSNSKIKSIDHRARPRSIYLGTDKGLHPYAAVWPPVGVINGRLKNISIPNVANKTLFVRFIKRGHSTTECGDPKAVVTLTDGQSSTPSQIEAIFGSEQPKFPLTFIACAGTSHGLVGNSVAINITYTLNE